MFLQNHTGTAGILGMLGAIIFFLALLIEYGYLAPGSSTLQSLNQVQFLVAMCLLLVMLLGMRAARAGGEGRFGRTMLTLFPIAWAALILATLISITTGNDGNLFFPLGGLSTMLFGLLAGIAVALAGKWHGWTRYALLLQGMYNFLLIVGTTILTGSPDPMLLTESLFMATWFLTSLALYVNGRTGVATQPVG